MHCRLCFRRSEGQRGHTIVESGVYGHGDGIGPECNGLLRTLINYVPQASVAAHIFPAGLGAAHLSSLPLLHVTVPGLPDLPAATPHLVAHPVAPPLIQVPGVLRVYGRRLQSITVKCEAATSKHKVPITKHQAPIINW